MTKSATPKAIVHIPEAFDFNTIDTAGLSDTERRNVEHACYYILHLLTRHHRSAYHLEKLEKENGFYRLCSKTLKENCGDEYAVAIATLLEEGVIEKGPNYVVGLKCNSYRLSEEMGAGPSKIVELAGKVNERNQKVALNLKQRQEESVQDLEHLTKWFCPEKLTLNTEDVHNFVELAASKAVGLIENDSGLTKEQREEAKGRVNLKLNHQIGAVRALLAGEYNVSRSPSNERLHSVMTSMKRELRSFLEFEGQPLVSLDIKASQPYLLTMLLRRSFYSKSKQHPLGWKSLTKTVRDDNSPRTQEHSTLPSTQGRPPLHTLPARELHSTMFPGVSQSAVGQSFKRSGFFKIDWSRDFYTQFCIQHEKLEHKTLTRKKAKQRIMWVLFEHRNFKYSKEDFVSFCKLFPLEGQLIEGIGKLKPKLLPLLLQRLESRIMLDIVTKRISETLPECPIFTVHDSVLTTPEYVEEVEQIMTQQLEQLVGLKPGITVERKTAMTELDNLESFVEGIVDEIKVSVNKKASMSFAKCKRDVPLAFKLPEYRGLKTFSAVYYDPDEANSWIEASAYEEEYQQPEENVEE